MPEIAEYKGTKKVVKLKDGNNAWLIGIDGRVTVAEIKETTFTSFDNLQSEFLQYLQGFTYNEIRDLYTSPEGKDFTEHYLQIKFLLTKTI